MIVRVEKVIQARTPNGLYGVGFSHDPLYDYDTGKEIKCIVPNCKGKRFTTVDLDDRYGTACDACGYIQQTGMLKTKINWEIYYRVVQSQGW